jgi:GGDEF domain-containing protein
MANKNPQTQTTEQIMRQIIDMLRLDTDMRKRIREKINDDRFVMRIEGEEIFVTIGPIECDQEGYTDIALTPAEAIALAIRLIKKATELLGI